MLFFLPAVSSRRQEIKAKCSLTCEYLTEEDYTDLLWTTLSEFPGKEQGAAPDFPWNGSGCGNGLWQQQWNWDVWPEPSHSTSELLSAAGDPPCPGITPEKNQSLLWNGPSVCSNPATLQEEENQLKGAETLTFLSISDFPEVFSKDDGYSESMENLLPKSLCPVIFRQFQQISMTVWQ